MLGRDWNFHRSKSILVAHTQTASISVVAVQLHFEEYSAYMAETQEKRTSAMKTRGDVERQPRPLLCTEQGEVLLSISQAVHLTYFKDCQW